MSNTSDLNDMETLENEITNKLKQRMLAVRKARHETHKGYKQRLEKLCQEYVSQVDIMVGKYQKLVDENMRQLDDCLSEIDSKKLQIKNATIEIQTNATHWVQKYEEFIQNLNN